MAGFNPLQHTGSPSNPSNVVGPASSTDNAIALFDGTTGKLLKDSGVTIESLTSSGEFVFFLENEADPVISGYKVMDNPAQLEAKATVTQATVSEGAIIQNWITDVGLPGTTFVPDGTWQFKVNAFKTGGTKETRIYNEIYKRAEDGTETLLGTTANSIILTTTEVDLPAFNIYIGAQTLLETDRLVTKTRIRLIGGGSDPDSVTVAYSGTTAARLQIPAQAVDVTKFVRTTGNQTAAGVKTWSDNAIFSTSLSTPAITTASGALGITPAAGSNLNVALSTTGDFAVNTNQLYVDTSAGNVGIGATNPSSKLFVQNTTGAIGGNTVTAQFDTYPTNGGGSGITRTSVSGGSYYADIEQNNGGAGPFRYGTYVDTNIVNSYAVSGGAYGNINFVTGNVGGSSIAMTIGGGTQKGNVGIGTTNPQTKLALPALSAISFEASAGVTDIALTHSVDTLTLSGGNLALGTNSLTLTGSIGATGARATKGWFTDLEVTNAIAGSITGNAATVTTNANLTGDVTSVGNATTIAVDAVDIPMLSATGTADATTYLRGDNTWATIAGGGDVTAAANFAVDNVLIKSDGTTKGVQATGITIADTSNDISGAGKYTGTGALLSGLTASEIVITDTSKNLVSAAVATYPSLTELTYVKGVTSAIQTQLNGKQATGNYITALTGDVTASGPGSVASTIAADAVTTAKILNSNVTYAKIQNVSATDRVLGRTTAGAGVVEEIATTGSGNVVRATSPTLVTPALGTPSALVGTNITGTASGLTAGTVTTNANLTGVVTSTGNATAIADAALSIAKTSGLQTALDAKAPLASPSFTGTVTTAGNIELGHASDTTLSRSAAGVLAVEGVVIPSISSTNTLTNKRVTKRVTSETSSATPTINTDNTDIHRITALAVNITSMTTNLSGTPTHGQPLIIEITGTAARTISWGASFEASTVALPTTTVTTAMLTVGFFWNSATSKFRCVAVA